jgi:hypothetical protein
LSFYKTVADHIRARGMTLSVEQHVAFSGTQFSAVQFDFGKLPFDQFVALDRQMTETIILNIHPDFLTLLSEPDTFVSLTGYKEASTPEGAAAMIGQLLTGLDKGQTRVGAGAGSWLTNAVVTTPSRRYPSITSICTSIPLPRAPSRSHRRWPTLRSKPASPLSLMRLALQSFGYWWRPTGS